ncbi:Transcriptional regulator, AsnC family [hydrothermal vent metagenome]|uniref:Transcriptional regulator, AsnC family n=1 Tax=hydrothermal vent metagenome TaxID=652676 RepID=A0A3B0TR11_9ZZZZ
MDETDKKIIGFLRHSGRASITDISHALNLTRSLVRTRLDRMTGSGEILGFSVVLKNDAINAPVRALMMIEVEGRGTEKVIKQLAALPMVGAIHTTSGRWDLVAELGAATLEEFDGLLRQVRLIRDIANSETSLLLATRKYSRAGA